MQSSPLWMPSSQDATPLTTQCLPSHFADLSQDGSTMLIHLFPSSFVCSGQDGGPRTIQSEPTNTRPRGHWGLAVIMQRPPPKRDFSGQVGGDCQTQRELSSLYPCGHSGGGLECFSQRPWIASLPSGHLPPTGLVEHTFPSQVIPIGQQRAVS